MINNSNRLFENFDLSKTKYFRRTWKSKEDFFEAYNKKNWIDKQAFNSQIKAIFIINYRKNFPNKIVFSFKNYFIISNLIFLAVNLLLISFYVSTAIISLTSSLRFSEFMGSNFALVSIGYWFFIISYWSSTLIPNLINWQKIDKQEFFYVFNKGLKNHNFFFSNKEEIFDFIKSKPAQTIHFNWTEEDFHYFNILYSREINNVLIESSNSYMLIDHTNKAYLQMKFILYSFAAPVIRFWMQRTLKSQEFIKQENDYLTNPKYKKRSRIRNVNYPIRLFQNAKKRNKIVLWTVFWFVLQIITYSLFFYFFTFGIYGY